MSNTTRPPAASSANAPPPEKSLFEQQREVLLKEIGIVGVLCSIGIRSRCWWEPTELRTCPRKYQQVESIAGRSYCCMSLLWARRIALTVLGREWIQFGRSTVVAIRECNGQGSRRWSRDPYRGRRRGERSRRRNGISRGGQWAIGTLSMALWTHDTQISRGTAEYGNVFVFTRKRSWYIRNPVCAKASTAYYWAHKGQNWKENQVSGENKSRSTPSSQVYLPYPDLPNQQHRFALLVMQSWVISIS